MGLPIVTESDLQDFHAKHFSHAPLPVQFFDHPAQSSSLEYSCNNEPEERPDDDGLGYYADGVKRTLTDEQIALFRHTEIQTILRARRIRQEENGEWTPPPPKHDTKRVNDCQSISIIPQEVRTDLTNSTGRAWNPISSPKSSSGHGQQDALVGIIDGTTPDTTGSIGSSERTSSDRKHKNWAERQRRKKKDRKRKKRQHAAREERLSSESGGQEESDQWDPWHQATGPDAQKDVPVELDY